MQFFCRISLRLLRSDLPVSGVGASAVTLTHIKRRRRAAAKCYATQDVFARKRERWHVVRARKIARERARIPSEFFKYFRAPFPPEILRYNIFFVTDQFGVTPKRINRQIKPANNDNDNREPIVIIVSLVD